MDIKSQPALRFFEVSETLLGNVSGMGALKNFFKTGYITTRAD